MDNSKDKTTYKNPLFFCQQKSSWFFSSLLLTRFITTCVQLLGHYIAWKGKHVCARTVYGRQLVGSSSVLCYNINLLNTKRRLLYLKTQFVPPSKQFHLGYKNQSVYAVSGISRCLFSDKYKTDKYSVGRTYRC